MIKKKMRGKKERKEIRIRKEIKEIKIIELSEQTCNPNTRCTKISTIYTEEVTYLVGFKQWENQECPGGLQVSLCDNTFIEVVHNGVSSDNQVNLLINNLNF